MSAAAVGEDEEHAWQEMSELARLVQHNAAARLQLLEVEDMLVAWMDLPPESPMLHLPPASPYFRMLVHRLVEAFGVTHVSFGEGEDRHIVLQRNEDSKIPPVLLLDILDVADGPSLLAAAPQILRRSSTDRDDGSSTPQTPPAQVPSLAERQQAYEEARARIFARDYSDGVRGSPEDYERTTERERRVPVVAQRLIGRALGVATRGTRGGETQQTGQNGAGSSDTGQPGMTRSRKDMQTEERGPGEKAEGGLRNGEKVISSGGTGETPPAGLSGDGENRGQAGTSVARKTTGQANVGGKKERCGDAENGVHLSDGGRRKKESNRDFGKRELVLRSDKRQQRGLVEACEEAVIRSGGGSEPRKESAGKVTRVQPQSHRKRDRRRATKVRNGSQREQRASADELERGAILDMKTVRAKDMESGESAWRNGDPRVDEDGASNKNGLRSSDPERAKTTSFGVAGAERKVGRSPGQGAGARMFRMALPRGQVGQRDRTEKGVRSGELPEDETSAGERSCRESDGASCARDASEVENGGDILKASPSRRGESSMNDAAIDSAKLKLRVSQASELETSSPAENVESTVKRKGLPLVAGKMLSHALGLTQRGWSQVGRL